MYDDGASVRHRAVRALQAASFEDFELSGCGIKVICETAYSGYTTMPGSEMLLHMEGEEGWHSFTLEHLSIIE